MFSVAYGTEEFKGLVWTPQYCAQVLHHAAVACVRTVIFVAASSKKIRYVVIVRVPENVTTAYTHCVEQLSPYINWYHNFLNGTFLPGASRDTFGHAVDENTVRFTRKLADSIIDENSRRIASHQQPLPPAHHIVPWIISLWNHVKGSQYVVSRILIM